MPNTQISNTNNTNKINNLYAVIKKITKSPTNSHKLILFMKILENKFKNSQTSVVNKKLMLDIICKHKNNIDNIMTQKTIIQEYLNKVISKNPEYNNFQNNGLGWNNRAGNQLLKTNKLVKNNRSSTNSDNVIGIVLGEIKKGKENQKIVLICNNDIQHVTDTIEFLSNNLTFSMVTGKCVSVTKKKINLGDNLCLTLPIETDDKIIKRFTTNSMQKKFNLKKNNQGKYVLAGGKVQSGGLAPLIIVIIVIVSVVLFVFYSIIPSENNEF